MPKKNKGFSEEPAAFAAPKAAGRADTLKIRQIGNSLGVVLPKDLLAALRAREGDEILVTEIETGLQLHRKDAEFEEHMRLVEKVMARYPNTLRALAK
ncbi:MAG: AbrB/MazE/SpoVT family DNA-binding domain-containing protein [Pseudomonadota bacterium]